MKKKSLITALSLIVVLATADVYAQATPAAAPAAAVTPSTTAAASVDPALFNLHRKKQLESISEHIARMQKRQACIQAAENEKALSACSGVSEAMHTVGETKTTPSATVTTAVSAPAPVAPAPATAMSPASGPATLPASTPATPVKP